MSRWTSDHERLYRAWEALTRTEVRRHGRVRNLLAWCQRRWPYAASLLSLTRAQCRHACRQVNAWRHSIERPLAKYRLFPHQVAAVEAILSDSSGRLTWWTR